MPALQGTDIADLVSGTLNNLGRMKLTDVMSTYQNTIILKRLAKKNKMTFDGGTECEFNLIIGTNGSARAVGLYYQSQVNPVNVLSKGKMPWRHVTWNWGIDRREIAMNRAPNKIVDLIMTRRTSALGDAVLFFELRGWRCPAVTDTDNFMGIPYWIVKSNTAVTTNDGFNGGVPTGYTLVGNIDPTAVGISPKWNNYATQYLVVSKDDLIIKLWRASDFTDFMPLVDDIPTYNMGDDYGYYTTYNVKTAMKQILESQNDNLGMDLDPTADKLVFRRAPFVWVKQLDEDTTDPVYGINWGVFHFMGLRNEWMNETRIDVHSNQPTVSATHTDCTFNTYCTDRRRNFVLAKDVTMPA